MSLFKNPLALVGGVFFTLFGSSKFYNATKGWAEASFISDYGDGFISSLLLFIWFLFTVALIFVLACYLIHILEAALKIRIMRWFS